MNCVQVRGEDLIDRYVTGELSASDMDAFEQHFFSCEECLAAVQIGQAIRNGAGKAGLTVMDSPEVAIIPMADLFRRLSYTVAAAAAIAVLVFAGWREVMKPPKSFVASSAPHVVKPPVNPSPQQTVPVQTPEPAPEPQLLAANLGTIEAPPYRLSVLRGGNEDMAERFRKAMAFYTARDYRKTVAGLASIPVSVPGSGPSSQHVTDAGVQLYLGISHLMLAQDGDAVRTLRRAVGYGDTPYLESARFYLAKGLIRQKQYDAAATELERAMALNGDKRSQAQQLLKQLQAR